MAQAIPGTPYIDNGYDQESDDSYQDGQAGIAIGVAEDDISYVVLKMHDKNECSMNNNEDGEGDQAQKMQAARRLLASEDFDIPGETPLDRRRHCGSR